MQNQTDQTPGAKGSSADSERPETTSLDRDVLNQMYARVTRMDGQPEVIPLPYWGNSFLGRAARLQLDVEGYGDTPIQTYIEDELIIGRMVPGTPDQPDIDLTPFGAVIQGVSRRHVLIIKEGNLLKVADLASTNGTYLNGVRLQPRQPRQLRTGDRLSLGQLVIKVSSLI
jgi:hypothetical protein